MKIIAIFFMLSLLAGCATPSQRFSETALNFGFQSQVQSSNQFKHQIFTNSLNKSTTLHVYIDGDGTPWERQRWIANDPTARNPLILKLMQQDTNPAILLGRPCYYGQSQAEGCDNKYWTSHRYSEEVVNSMSQALNNWLYLKHFKKIVLIGYSGGGAIAMLMANNIAKATKIVTIAANLNVARWSDYHAVPKLNGSLNPAEEEPVNAKVKQIHFAGKEDKIVPAFIIKNYSSKQMNSKYYELPEQDHACCWERDWSKLLEIVE